MHLSKHISTLPLSCYFDNVPLFFLSNNIDFVFVISVYAFIIRAERRIFFLFLPIGIADLEITHSFFYFS